MPTFAWKMFNKVNFLDIYNDLKYFLALHMVGIVNHLLRQSTNSRHYYLKFASSQFTLLCLMLSWNTDVLLSSTICQPKIIFIRMLLRNQ